MAEIIEAQVEQVSILAPSILKIVLRPHVYIPYDAGQYLEINGVTQEPLFYSIANAPMIHKTYELHIQTHLDMPLLLKLRPGEMLNIRLPLGECSVSKFKKQRPLVLIAGGTGFAPMNAIIEDIHKNEPARHITLIWLSKNKEKLYMHECMQQLQRDSKIFNYLPCVTSRLSFSTDFKQHISTLALKEAEIILAGPFEMVYAVRDVLLQHGVTRAQLHADAFSLELLRNL